MKEPELLPNICTYQLLLKQYASSSSLDIAHSPCCARGQEFAADYDVDGLSNVYDFDEVFLETDEDDDDERTRGGRARAAKSDGHIPPTDDDAAKFSFMVKPPDRLLILRGCRR